MCVSTGLLLPSSRCARCLGQSAIGNRQSAIGDVCCVACGPEASTHWRVQILLLKYVAMPGRLTLDRIRIGSRRLTPDPGQSQRPSFQQ